MSSISSSARPGRVVDSGMRLQPSRSIPEVNPELTSILEEIEKYKSDPYVYDQLMNAYKSVASQKFYPNTLQQIGEYVGDLSARRNFENTQISELRSQMQKILEGQHKENISSASSELADMKAAGINVDLNGGHGISPQEGGSIDQSDIDNPIVNDGSSSVSSLFSAGAQIVSFAMQAYQGFMSVKSMHLDNLVKEFNLSDSARSLAWNLIGEGVSEFMTNPSFDESMKDDPSAVYLIPSLVKSFGSRVNSLPLSRKQRKYMHSVIDELVYTYDNDGKKIPSAKYQTLVNETLKKLYGSRADSVQEYGRVGSDIEDIAVQRVVSHDIYRPLNEMAIEIQNDLNYVTKLQAKYDSDYLNAANKQGLASMTVSADYVSKKMQYEIKSIQKKITDTFNHISRKIDSNKKLGPNWKMAFQTALAIGESFTINSMMSGLKSFNFSPRTTISSNHDNFAPHY